MFPTLPLYVTIPVSDTWMLTRVWLLDTSNMWKNYEKQTNLTLGHVLAPDTDTQI